MDRLPPHSIESEQGVLACCLQSQDCIQEAVLELTAGPEMFYDLRHQTLWDTLINMAGGVDIITVQQRLRDRNQLEAIGGIAYLASLPDLTASANNLQYYLSDLKAKYILRKTIQTCIKAASDGYEAQQSADNYISGVERDVLAIRQGLETKRSVADIRAIQAQLTDDYENAHKQGCAMGLLTGYSDLDRKLGGMMDQELIILAGVPSAGKTTLALNVAGRAAQNGVTVSVFSFETSAKKLVHRLNCMMGRIDGGAFFRGEPTEEHFVRMHHGICFVDRIREKLLIHDTGMTDGQLMAAARQDYRKGARLFVVDYLQLLQTKGKDEFERVTNASKALKNVAKELNVPVIAISSLSRQEKGEPRKPRMSDLRQSGQIEFDADKVLLLYCDDVSQPVRNVEGIIAKNKDGELGSVFFTFFASEFRMETQMKEID